MAEKNITTITINTTLIVVFMLAMLSSFILITNNEGRGEIFDDYPEIEEFNLNLTSIYTDRVVDTANINSNLSAFYNPELAISAADQSGNAMSLNMQNLTVTSWNSISVLFSLIFGNIWTGILSGLVLGLVLFLFTYYFIRWIRSGS